MHKKFSAALNANATKTLRVPPPPQGITVILNYRLKHDHQPSIILENLINYRSFKSFCFENSYFWLPSDIRDEFYLWRLPVSDDGVDSHLCPERHMLQRGGGSS